MNEKISLKFDNTITSLVGNSFGRETYENQVDGKYTSVEGLTIIFPECITFIGSSFIQGFFDKFVEDIKISGIEENIIVIADGIKDIKAYILSQLRL